MKRQFVFSGASIFVLMLASAACAQTGTPIANPSVNQPKGASSVSGNSAINNSPTTVTTPAGTNPTSTSNATTNSMNWDSQNSYWRDTYSTRPYYNSNRSYNVYEPAYRYGVDLYNKNPNTRYEDLNQSQIGSGWANARGNSDLGWADAQMAARDAYNRMYNANNQTVK